MRALRRVYRHPPNAAYRPLTVPRNGTSGKETRADHDFARGSTGCGTSDRSRASAATACCSCSALRPTGSPRSSSSKSGTVDASEVAGGNRVRGERFSSATSIDSPAVTASNSGAGLGRRFLLAVAFSFAERRHSSPTSGGISGSRGGRRRVRHTRRRTRPGSRATCGRAGGRVWRTTDPSPKRQRPRRRRRMASTRPPKTYSPSARTGRRSEGSGAVVGMVRRAGCDAWPRSLRSCAPVDSSAGSTARF